MQKIQLILHEYNSTLELLFYLFFFHEIAEVYLDFFFYQVYSCTVSFFASWKKICMCAVSLCVVCLEDKWSFKSAL